MLYKPDKMNYVSVHHVQCNNCKRKIIYPLAADIRMNHYQYKSREEQQIKVITNENDAISESRINENFFNNMEDKGILYLTSRISICYIESK